MYGVEGSFWLKLLLLVTVYFLLITLFNAIMRRWLGVEKRKAFSYNHINDKHRKIDWTIRIVFLCVLLIGGFVNVGMIPQEPLFFLQPWFLLFVLLFLSETIRAVMERKYAKNPNAYIFTICQSAFILVLVILLFATDFFGLV